MTEQTKIPLPNAAGPARKSAGEQGAGSLIERAAKTFDFGSFAPPPVPVNLAPPVPKPAARHRKAAGSGAVSGAVPEPVVPAATEAVAEVAPTPAPAPVLAKAKAAVEPSTFKGPRHKVDREHLRDQGLIVPEGAVTALLEEFRIVKRQLLLQANELKRSGGGALAQRVLICSPHPSEGKTYSAVNLALSMAAEKENEVLLVDADFAKPSVLSALGLPGGRGLMDALTDPKIDVLDCVIGTDIPGLWVLPAGSQTNSDSEYLNSRRTATVLDRLTQGVSHRMVIFDSPPALAASPAAELAKYVGQALVVVRADKTGQGAIEDAISLLSACPNIQLLLNAVNFSPSGRKFGSYYGYGG